MQEVNLVSNRQSTSDDRDRALIGMAGEDVERWRRIQTALVDLLDGYDYARDLGRDVWDFAVEIDQLEKRGLRAEELRWLIAKGWILHAFERPSPFADRRCFIAAPAESFDQTSCFALSTTGAQIHERLSPWPLVPTTSAHASAPQAERGGSQR
jgi:hypothetical protein